LSYLPLASDMELSGKTKDKGFCSAMVLLSILVISLLLDTVGAFFGIVLLSNWAAHLLLYAFVISFPLQPLDGSDVWRYHKGWWFGIFFLITLCFLLNIPDGFYGIL